MTKIDDLRNRMDEITLEMVNLLKNRTEIAKEIGVIKKELGISITDETRESLLRSKVISLCHEIGLDESISTKFLNFLLNESVKIQSENKQTHLSVFLKAKSLEAQGKKIIHMEVGEPDFAPPIIVKKALGEVFDKGFGKYGQAKGMMQLRDAIAKKTSKQYSIDLTHDNVIVCPGARFAVYLAITTILNPGDEIIIIEPAWPAYQDCALNAGVKVRKIRTTLENGWEPSISELTSMINANTKMIVLNYPNNPTGKILPESLQDEIIKIAIKKDLHVLSDEIYSQYAYKNWKSVLSYNYKKSIVTQSYSKSHSMTGYRIGYAVANPELVNKMAALQALCMTNVSEPIQYVALQALDADISNNAKMARTKLDIIVNKAKEMDLDFVVPDGAMYLFANVKKKNFDCLEFTNIALDKGVAVAPGNGFGDYRDYIRISACQEEKKLMEGMDILNQVIRGMK